MAMLNNFACSLPPLANVNWSAFPECFFRPCESTTGEMAPIEASDLAVGPDMTSTVSAHLSRPCSGILAFVGACTCHSYTKLYYLCLLSFLFKHLPLPTPHPHTSCHPLIYAGPILMNSMKKRVKN